MKYNAHIYCAGFGFDLPSAAVVLFCKQKLLNRLSITHDPDYVSIVYRVTR